MKAMELIFVALGAMVAFAGVALLAPAPAARDGEDQAACAQSAPYYEEQLEHAETGLAEARSLFRRMKEAPMPGASPLPAAADDTDE